MTNDSNSVPSAYVTVTDAAGRVLFRRLATEREIAEARALAVEADASARAALDELALRRAQYAAANGPPQFADPAPPGKIATEAGDAQLQGIEDFEFEDPETAAAAVADDATKSHRWWIDSATPEEPPLFDQSEMDALGLRRTNAHRE